MLNDLRRPAGEVFRTRLHIQGLILHLDGLISLALTGVARGIGRAVALKFAMEGARVAAIDINTEELSHLKDELEKYTKEILCLKCDISDEARVNEAAAEVLEKFKKVDILVNNAALWKYHCNFINYKILHRACLKVVSRSF